MIKKVKKAVNRKAPAGFAKEICEHVASGKTLLSYSKGLNRPSVVMIDGWAKNDEAFREKLKEAHEIGHSVLLDECLEICDTFPDCNQKIFGSVVAWQKNRIETRLKVLAKLNPEKYGDKKFLAGDKDNPLAITEIKRVIIDSNHPFEKKE